MMNEAYLKPTAKQQKAKKNKTKNSHDMNKLRCYGDEKETGPGTRRSQMGRSSGRGGVTETPQSRGSQPRREEEGGREGEREGGRERPRARERERERETEGNGGRGRERERE